MPEETTTEIELKLRLLAGDGEVVAGVRLLDLCAGALGVARVELREFRTSHVSPRSTSGYPDARSVFHLSTGLLFPTD